MNFILFHILYKYLVFGDGFSFTIFVCFMGFRSGFVVTGIRLVGRLLPWGFYKTGHFYIGQNSRVGECVSLVKLFSTCGVFVNVFYSWCLLWLVFYNFSSFRLKVGSSLFRSWGLSFNNFCTTFAL